MTETKILNGKNLAKITLDSLIPLITELKKKGIVPKLAIIMVGHNPASEIYVNNKIKRCAEYGLASEIIRFDPKCHEEDVIAKLSELNNDTNIHGIIIQMPTANHLNNANLIESIDPKKDVDGFHPFNLGLLASNHQGGFVSCTPLGCLNLIWQKFPDITGKNIVIVGRSKIVGRPLASLLLNHNATVTICHSNTTNLKQHTSKADIVICAVGKAEFFDHTYFNKKSVVIDVGINMNTRENSRSFCGDVNFSDVNGKIAAISPVPGGVGPLTVAYLLHNLVKAAAN